MVVDACTTFESLRIANIGESLSIAVMILSYEMLCLDHTMPVLF